MVTAAMKLKDTFAPWKKSYDPPRQHIKDQRHDFADKGPSSQSYGFSSSHVWICECESHLVVSVSLRPHELYNPWNSPGQNPGVGNFFLFPTDLPNPGIELGSPALQMNSLPTELSGKPPRNS